MAKSLHRINENAVPTELAQANVLFWGERSLWSRPAGESKFSPMIGWRYVDTLEHALAKSGKMCD